MPNPDGAVSSRDLADGAVTSRVFAQDIHSDNYVEGVSGWRIRRDTGDAEFGNVIVRGRIESSTVTGGTIQTSASLTAARVVMGDAFPSGFRFFTGDAEEDIDLGGGGFSTLKTSVNGSGATRTLFMSLIPPRFNGAGNQGRATISFHSESQDGTTAVPAITLNATGGTFDFNEGHIRIGVSGSAGALSIPAATADPTSPADVPRDGTIYVNTSSNQLKLYEGGAWRTIASW